MADITIRLYQFVCMECGRRCVLSVGPIQGYENQGFYQPPVAPRCPCIDADMYLQSTTVTPTEEQPPLNVIHPGNVRSRTDGDVVYVGYKDLIRLYGLDPKDCVLASSGWRAGHRRVRHFYPRYDGDYSL